MLNQLLRELLEQLIAQNQLELSQEAHLPTLIRDLQRTMDAALAVSPMTPHRRVAQPHPASPTASEPVDSVAWLHPLCDSEQLEFTSAVS